MKLKSKDLILHMLNAKGSYSGEPILGITRFQKMIFLFEKEIWPNFKFDKIIPENELPQFEPYFFGPFSEKVNEDIDFLCSLGFIKKTEIDFSNIDPKDKIDFNQISQGVDVTDSRYFNTSQFSLSTKGQKFIAAERAGKLSNTQREILDQFKLKCTSVPLGSLLKYVYVKYPAMTIKSQIRKTVLGSHA